ncbi:MAG: hypothetical protein ACON4W_09030 [Parvibaculales bacterium]
MSKITREQLDIQDAFEAGDLKPFFDEYVLANKKPPKRMIERLQWVMTERSLTPVLKQKRSGPAKKSDIPLSLKIEFFERKAELQKNTSATEAKHQAAKEFGINTRKADKWLADAQYIHNRLLQDGKEFS